MELYVLVEEMCLSSFQITFPHDSRCEGCLPGESMCLSFTEQVPGGLGGVSGKALAFNKATHLEPSFHGGANHPLLFGLLQLLLIVFAYWFYFSFLFNRPQEGEIAARSQLQIYPLSLVAKGHWAASFCKHIFANK